jgi:multiple antibiotic resistance protein
MPLSKVALLSFIALITMVNPLAVIPAFVSLTDGVSQRIRASVAFIAGMSCIVVLTLFLLAGTYLFKFFGITVPAFQIMGGIIFLTNALNTLVADDRRAVTMGGEKRTEERDVEKAELDPTSIAVVPLAIPMLSGPGAIATVMVLVNTYPSIEQKMAVVVAITAVGLASWAVLLTAMPISHFVGNRGRAVFARIMALLLGAIGIQFIINGIRPVMQEIIRTAS